MNRRSSQVALEQEEVSDESVCARIRRFRAKPQVEAAEDPQDTLLRKILGAQNRMWLMPYPASARAAKDFNTFCKQYRKRFGHLTVPTSLPLRLVRRPVLEEAGDDKPDCQILPFRKISD